MGKVRADLVVNSYISAMDMRSVVVLALCGVCSAYQATTARTGALANQVTMMAKSKVAPMFDAPDGLKGYVGEEDGFDPLRLSSAFDMKWLREAEVKHGRICMLAFVGFVAGDLLPLPGVTLSSVAAHDANLGDYGGAMGQIFWWIGLVEILGSIPAINYTMNGGDREPGDYAFDPLGFLASATPAQKEEMQLKELKNGRLAMMAFSGIVTQAALGHPNFPYV